MASSQSFSMIQRRMLLSPWAGVPGKQGAPVVNLGHPAAQGRVALHLAGHVGHVGHVGQEEHLPVAGPGHEGVFGTAPVVDQEALVLEAGLPAHAVQVSLPTFPVGGIAEHEIKGPGLKGIVGEGGVLGTAYDGLIHVPLPLEKHVGLADRVGLVVDLLAVEVGGYLLVLVRGDPPEGLLGDGQHPAGADGAVVEQVCAGLNSVPDGLEHQLGHELHGVPGGPVLAGLLVVVLVEAAHQVLEDGPHGVVVQSRVPHRAVGVQDRFGTEVYLGRQEPADDVAQHVGCGEPGDLVAELELLEDVLDVGREAVQVGVEVVPELLLSCPGGEVLELEGGGIVEGLASSLFDDCGLVLDSDVVQPLLLLKDFSLGGLQHGVQTPEDGHGEDDVAVLASHVEVAEVVVGDSPDEVGYLAELVILQGQFSSSGDSDRSTMFQ